MMAPCGLPARLLGVSFGSSGFTAGSGAGCVLAGAFLFIGLDRPTEPGNRVGRIDISLLGTSILGMVGDGLLVV